MRIRLFFLLAIVPLMAFHFLQKSAVVVWGFHAHKKINRMATFTLPPEMFVFYKHNIEFITEHAVDPDKRRYAVEGEAQRHFIDIDHYKIPGEDVFKTVPKKWKDAIAKYTEDTIQEYGIVPWHINHHLTQVFRMRVSKRETFLPLCKACASVNLKLICKKDFNERNQLNYFSLYLIVTKRRCARLCGVG